LTERALNLGLHTMRNGIIPVSNAHSYNSVNEELQSLLSTPALNKAKGQGIVRSLRNEVQADWVSDFMDKMHSSTEKTVDASSHCPVNEKTGKVHTVESMVSELRERVNLDFIDKEAEDAKPSELKDPVFPLSYTMVSAAFKKKADAVKSEISQFINDLYASHRGGVDKMAVIWSLREKYGIDTLRDLKEFIDSEIESARVRNPNVDVSSMLPRPYMGTPTKSNPQADAEQPLFENIKNV